MSRLMIASSMHSILLSGSLGHLLARFILSCNPFKDPDNPSITKALRTLLKPFVARIVLRYNFSTVKRTRGGQVCGVFGIKFSALIPVRL